MRHLFAFLVMLLFCVASSAQQLVFGSVRDGFLKVPLVNARVTLLTADSVCCCAGLHQGRVKQKRWRALGKSFFQHHAP